jgi:hypothetical protein
MNQRPLRPPLPETLTHDGITFIFDSSSLTSEGGEISHEVLALIAAGLQVALPEGDLTVNQSGQLTRINESAQPTQPGSLWYKLGLIEGIDRSLK